MTQITQNQALERWDILSPILREALYSETNSDFLWKTCEDEHIPQKQIYIVSQIAGHVLMGFLHPEDVAQELKNRLGIAPQTASSIEEAFNKRMFSPLRAEIDKVYQPISKLEVPTAPKIIQDIDASFQKINGPLSVMAKPTQAVPPPAPKPSLSDTGWSKVSPSDPMVKLSQAQMPPSVPKPAAPQTAPQQKPAAPAPMQSAGGEFERLARTQNAPGATPRPPMPTPPPNKSGPAPMMLHEDPEIKSIKGSSDFRISMSYQEGNIIGSSKPQAPSKPAVIEFGGKPTPSSAPTPPAARVVHYTEFKPSMPTPPQTGSAGRNVMEITAPSKTSATPPMPSTPSPIPKPSAPIPLPQIPKPPAPPTPPVGNPGTPTKVINKDYV